jgi:magnesium-dependent phosphatase 1
VASLGVTFCLVRDGVDDRTFERGLADWRARNPELVAEDAAGDATAAE